MSIPHYYLLMKIMNVWLMIQFYRYFEFRLCPNPQAKQECLDKHLLQLINDFSKDPTTKFYPRNGSTIYEIKAILPKGKPENIKFLLVFKVI